MKPLVINGTATYGEAPVAAACLRADLAGLLAALPEENRDKYLLLDSGDTELIAYVKEKSENRLKVLAVDPGYGFAYLNAAAAAKVLEGEKPIPSGMEEPVVLRTVEDLLCSSHKAVVIDLGKGQSVSASLGRTATVDDLLEQCHCSDAKAIYFGYPMSMLLTTDNRALKIDLTADYIALIQKDDCILDRLVGITHRYLRECCGRCVLGYEGVTQAHTILSDIAQKKGKSGDVDLLVELCEMMQSQSLCDIGTAAGRLILSAIEHFRPELEGHITKKTCVAGVCRKFVTFHILQERCAGCGACVDVCEDDAITGKKKFVHIIDQDECIQCGRCMQACPQGAIITAGTVKPKCPKKPIVCKQ